MAHEEEEHSVKLLVPVANYVDRAKLAEALHALSIFKDPLIVLLHVVEVPFSAPLDPTLQKDEVYKAGQYVTPIAEWLREQKYHVKIEIRTARKSAEGIIEEANAGGYSAVLLMKRRPPQGWRRFFHRSDTERVIQDVNCLNIVFLVDRAPKS
jgi:nucleotide-binding universal stress UspA family protein